MVVAVGSLTNWSALERLAPVLAEKGAETRLLDERLLPLFRAAGEPYGRPARTLANDERIHALLFDARSARTPEELRSLYDFCHALVGRLAKCGRVLVLGGAVDAEEPLERATQAALEGFVRSLAKEIGRAGSTANLLRIAPGAEASAEGPATFFLGRRSAFVTAQVLEVSLRAGARPTNWSAMLDGAVALVAGAARGIGEATARSLAAEGAKVICLDRPEDDGAISRIAREIGGIPLGVDVTAADAGAAVAEVARSLGALDIVVHNAGVTRDKTLARMDEARWNQVIDINLTAIARMQGSLDRVMRDGGRVIALSSIAGIAGNVGQTNYAASKAGVIGWVRALAERHARRGITVNAIAPGFIETRLTAAIPMAIREGARRLSALGQGGLPEDVAAAITFLAMPSTQGVTGAVLRVCGGALVGA